MAMKDYDEKIKELEETVLYLRSKNDELYKKLKLFEDQKNSSKENTENSLLYTALKDIYRLDESLLSFKEKVSDRFEEIQYVNNDRILRLEKALKI